MTADTDPGNVQGGPVFDRTLTEVSKLTRGEFEIIVDRGILSHYNMHLMLTEKRAFFIGPMKEELCRSWLLDTLLSAGITPLLLLPAGPRKKPGRDNHPIMKPLRPPTSSRSN